MNAGKVISIDKYNKWLDETMNRLIDWLIGDQSFMIPFLSMFVSRFVYQYVCTSWPHSLDSHWIRSTSGRSENTELTTVRYEMQNMYLNIYI